MPKVIKEYELERRYEEMLDEVHGEVQIAGLTYSTSNALKSVDPTAYRCGFADWLDSEIGETVWEKDGDYYDADPSEDEDTE